MGNTPWKIPDSCNSLAYKTVYAFVRFRQIVSLNTTRFYQRDVTNNKISRATAHEQ